MTGPKAKQVSTFSLQVCLHENCMPCFAATPLLSIITWLCCFLHIQMLRSTTSTPCCTFATDSHLMLWHEQVPRLERQQAEVLGALGHAACSAHPAVVRQLCLRPSWLRHRRLLMPGDPRPQLQQSAARQLATAGSVTTAAAAGCIRCSYFNLL